jgi:NitT/TauT family transport system substrate-binding protein
MKRSIALGQLSAMILVAGTPLRVRAADELKVRVAYAAVELSSAFYAAIEMGFFQKAGLTVEAQPMSTGAAMSAAVAAGSIDVGDVNVVSMAQAYEKGIPLTYIALDGLYSSSEPADALVVSGAAPINSGRDLNGKTIAINVLNGIAYVGVRSWVDKNGGDSSTIRFAEMPFSVMPEALNARRVDAILVSEPELRHARDGGGRVLGFAYDTIASRFVVAGWVANTSWVKNNLVAARRFHDAMLQADIWSNHNRDKTAEFVHRYAKVEPSIVKTMSRATFPERSDVALAQPVIDACARYGLLKSAFPAANLFSRDIMG